MVGTLEDLLATIKEIISSLNGSNNNNRLEV